MHMKNKVTYDSYKKVIVYKNIVYKKDWDKRFCILNNKFE